ncbi:MAG TPA: DUF1254 domain-containing protein [Solirubrobacteraceae bacterium]|nr:DUF1254 domain-containing protein [Solirubrobacteraceae bacterium]
MSTARASRLRLGAGGLAAALLIALLGIWSPGAALGRGAARGLTQAQAEQIGLDAYVYGIPLMEFVRQARTQTSVTVPNALSDAPLNQLGNARQLASASHQVIVQPNLDTLYSMAHLDLARGPLVLHVPAVAHHRYYSFQFLDPYTNAFHYIGTRTTGDGAGTFVIVGPRFRGRLPRGLRRIRSPYDRAWLVGRTLVYGPADLAAVHRIQDGYRLLPLAAYLRHGLRWRPPRPHRVITRHTSHAIPTGLAYFDQLGTALAQNPPPARDAAILRELRRVGVGPGLHPSREHLSAAILAGLRQAAAGGPAYIFSLRTKVAAASVLAHDGWVVPRRDLGNYGTDYTYRAVVAVYGLAANRLAEAMYIIGATDPAHQLLSGTHDYVIHFAAGQLPPTRYFWSLTMYDQNFYLVPNALHRYALGSHTAGLQRNPDGSLDIYLQHTAPASHVSNWLPAPAGTFEVTLRLYGPLPSALHGRYVYPPILRVVPPPLPARDGGVGRYRPGSRWGPTLGGRAPGSRRARVGHREAATRRGRGPASS